MPQTDPDAVAAIVDVVEELFNLLTSGSVALTC